MGGSDKSAICVKLGARARSQIENRGLQPADIACIPAAAGGPKGLGLIPLDQWLFGEWFPAAQHMPTLIGASIGAWRMAAAAQPDARQALAELSRTYIEDQIYQVNPPPAEVARLCRLLARSMFVDGRWQPREDVALRVITARASGVLGENASRRAFAHASIDNLAGRARLARHLRRVVFASGPASPLDDVLSGQEESSPQGDGSWRGPGFDHFGSERTGLTASNAEAALLASGSIPLLCDPVKAIPGAHPGWYWDGGLIDYHLFYPYARLEGLVLYPHFTDFIVPGWLDKFAPWRRQGVNGRGRDWLANMILISPSQSFLQTLPNHKLPDRKDFHRYGQDHRRRIADWNRAVSNCGKFAEEAAAWLKAPDLSIALPL